MGAPIHQSSKAQGREPLGTEHTKAGGLPSSGFSPRNGYRLASEVYDAEPNPVLALEHRFLQQLLPQVKGLDVVDLGCGTGRWLAALVSQEPQTLLGIDCSPEMLAQAKLKLNHAATLVLADCENLPLLRSSADLVVCSFLVSYLPDLAVFAEQLRRLMRPSTKIFITDLHPATASMLGWRRGFHVHKSFVELTTYSHAIEHTVSEFEHAGIRVDALIEPHFGCQEFEYFQRAGKAAAFRSCSGLSAIYILQLSLKHRCSVKPKRTIQPKTLSYITGARVALGAGESAQVNVGIEEGRITWLGRTDQSRTIRGTGNIDLSGFLLLPGLINAHDHLDFALFPRLGKGGYHNFVEWADDIHHPDSSPVREHRAVPKNIRLWWGGVRNLICGATTVCHHNPYVREVFNSGFAVRVLRDFGWAHSLPMDRDVATKHKKTRPDRPFIIHLAEGVDSQSAEEIFRLAGQNALDDRTVIVHGLGLDERGKSLMRSSQAALIWCPTSNVFLFGRTHNRQTIQSLPRVALGSDSPLTSQGDLFNEIRFAHKQVGIPPDELYSLVTTRAAQALRLKNGQGTLRPGAFADLIGIRDTGSSPADTLVSISARDVELVVIGSRVQLASSSILDRLPRPMTAELQPLEIDGQVRWIRAPLDRLFAVAESHVSGGLRLGGKKIRNGPPA